MPCAVEKVMLDGTRGLGRALLSWGRRQTETLRTLTLRLSRDMKAHRVTEYEAVTETCRAKLTEYGAKDLLEHPSPSTSRLGPSRRPVSAGRSRTAGRHPGVDPPPPR